MEKVTTYEESIQRVFHRFYCDECMELIGSSKELADGYFPILGDFEVKFYLGSWYVIKKTLCDKCRPLYIQRIQNALESVGFQKGG